VTLIYHITTAAE